MMGDALTRAKDGQAWRIGTAADVAWITSVPGLTIAAAIPPVFDEYATLTLPEALGVSRDHADEGAQDNALMTLLTAHTRPQPWWLGYLETGASDIVFWDAPQVTLYSGWNYVFVLAGPDQAGSWRPAAESNWKSSELPDIMFPEDRSWLVSMLWDDDWYCLGGPRSLIDAVVTDPLLGARASRVAVAEDATPAGFTAL
jgi:hypothetical protein